MGYCFLGTHTKSFHSLLGALQLLQSNSSSSSSGPQRSLLQNTLQHQLVAGKNVHYHLHMDESVRATDAGIDRCRALAEKQSRPLYLEYVPELGADPSVPRLLQAMEWRLAASPCDSVLRFAALYPLWMMNRSPFADEKGVRTSSLVTPIRSPPSGALLGVVCSPE